MEVGAAPNGVGVVGKGRAGRGTWGVCHYSVLLYRLPSHFCTPSRRERLTRCLCFGVLSWLCVGDSSGLSLSLSKVSSRGAGRESRSPEGGVPRESVAGSGVAELGIGRDSVRLLFSMGRSRVLGTASSGSKSAGCPALTLVQIRHIFSGAPPYGHRDRFLTPPRRPVFPCNILPTLSRAKHPLATTTMFK